MITTSTRPSWGRTLRRRPLLAVLVAIAALVTVNLTPSSDAASAARNNRPAKPTVVLVHGSWADASSWNGVIERLEDDGFQVVALANPLQSLAGDAAFVRAYLDTVAGPIVLVAHSYGGAVITNAALGQPNVRALVYVNAFMPDAGESATGLAGPDSALSADPSTIFDLVPAGPPTPASYVYLKTATVFGSFATGLSANAKAIVAATQRPATLGALTEPSGEPAWRSTPSWALIGTKDRIIPATVQHAMAARAGATTTEYNAGHVGLMTNPATVVQVVERAAKAATS
jgi:pimeloyl-ACP methyl ester carboxylesterase